ncbi:hypothetical protein VNO78_20000 [Psophocarpus tetragonolobus]|uniref:Uncharacterized protein n=1 Tax=Psophocarpus tetragonolobus TaxID=3891 RepID=A0AAN9XH47_PSOTE
MNCATSEWSNGLGRASDDAECSQAREWVIASIGKGKGAVGMEYGEKKWLVDCMRLRARFERIWGLGWKVGMYGKTHDLTVQKWEEKKRLEGQVELVRRGPEE